MRLHTPPIAHAGRWSPSSDPHPLPQSLPQMAPLPMPLALLALAGREGALDARGAAPVPAPAPALPSAVRRKPHPAILPNVPDHAGDVERPDLRLEAAPVVGYLDLGLRRAVALRDLVGEVAVQHQAVDAVRVLDALACGWVVWGWRWVSEGVVT